MKVQYNDIGSLLRDARLEAGVSQIKLAKKIGIPKERISRYENNHVEPSLGTLARFLKGLGVTVVVTGNGRFRVEEE